MDYSPHASILGLIVSYNGGSTLVATAEAACVQVDQLLIIDNHSQADSIHLIGTLTNSHANIAAQLNTTNIGLAAALNQGIAFAVERGFQYLLTLDQDSVIHPGMVAALHAVCSSDNTIGIASPWTYFVADGKVSGREPETKLPYSTDRVWTGGSLSPVDTLLRVGGFPENYFIDYVDYALCYKIRKSGLKVVVVPAAHMTQRRAALRSGTFAGRKVFYSNYSAARRYYIARNGLILSWQMRSLSSLSRHLSLLANETAKVLLFEENKGLKLRMTLLGIFHGATGRMGPLRLNT